MRDFIFLLILLSTLAHANEKSLLGNSVKLNANGNCFQLNLGELENNILSCQKTIAIQYIQKNCADLSDIEKGTSEAKLTCDGKKKIRLEFNTKGGSVTTVLAIKRANSGKQGLTSQFYAKNTEFSGETRTDLSKAQIEPPSEAIEPPVEI